MPFGNGKTGTPISKQRLNGLKLKAIEQRRTVTAQLDIILESAGIKEVSDGEFDKQYKKIMEMKA